MSLNELTLLTLGYALYALALLLKSTNLVHLKFGSILDLSRLQRMPPPVQRRAFLVLLALSWLLMGAALRATLNTDRKSFEVMAMLGGLLIGVRLLAFLSPRIAFLGLEIEADPQSKLSLEHVSRSPFVRGGLVLMLIGGGAPLALDALLSRRFKAHQEAEWAALVAEAASKDFHARYRPRSLHYQGAGQSEEEFFEALTAGRRFVIEGRAGVGKSWFLMRMRFHFREQHRRTRLFFIEAKELMLEESEHGTAKGVADPLEHLNRDIFRSLSWGALPVTKKLVSRGVILIDGLDEVDTVKRLEVTELITRFSKAFPESAIVVTTRPLGMKMALEGFETAELPIFTAERSDTELKQRMDALSEKLREQVGPRAPDKRLLRMLQGSPALDGSSFPVEQTERLYRAFTETFGFAVRVPGAAGTAEVMPFLGTFSDMDIVDALLVESLSGKLALPEGPREAVRKKLLEEFMRRRIKGNFHEEPMAPELIEGALDELTQQTANALEKSLRPHARKLVFPKSDFTEIFFGSTTFDQFVIESELLVEEDGNLVLDNPVLAEYFIARASHRGPGLSR